MKVFEAWGLHPTGPVRLWEAEQSEEGEGAQRGRCEDRSQKERPLEKPGLPAPRYRSLVTRTAPVRVS